MSDNEFDPKAIADQWLAAYGKMPAAEASAVARDMVTLAAAYLKLETALAESVKLQSHYAECLNMHDGGERRTFTADEWIARLIETETFDPLTVRNYPFLADVKPVRKP